jgi:hypothetical protein
MKMMSKGKKTKKPKKSVMKGKGNGNRGNTYS